MPISRGVVARIEYTSDAIADIKALGDFIADAGGHERAERYLRRLERRMSALEVFPHVGSRVAIFGSGTRLLGFDKRVTILFRRRRRNIVILRILYAGRQP